MKRSKIKEESLTLKGIVIFMFLCLLLTLCSCTEEKKAHSETEFDENGLFVSESLNYGELKAFYSENKEVSLNDAEGKLAQMGITEGDAEYRVLIQKIEDTKHYTSFLEFYLLTSESEKTYTIEEIRNASVTITENQDLAVFLGDFICWLRDGNKIEFSLNGDIYESEDIKESVVYMEEKKDKSMQLHYLTEEQINGKDGEYIYVHDTIML